MLENVVPIPDPDRPKRVIVYFVNEVEIRFDFCQDWELN